MGSTEAFTGDHFTSYWTCISKFGWLHPTVARKSGGPIFDFLFLQAWKRQWLSESARMSRCGKFLLCLNFSPFESQLLTPSRSKVMTILLKGLFCRCWNNFFVGLGSTVLMISPLLLGLFQPSQDENLSPGVALKGPLVRFVVGWADGPPEAIDSPNFT